MKKLFILFAGAVIVIGSVWLISEAKKERETPITFTETPITVAPIETTDIVKKQEELFNEFKRLYKELMAFKSKADFVQYGFSTASPYNSWLQKVENLINDKDSKLLVSKGVVAGELKQLGLTYATSNGKENDVTNFFNEAFEKAISPKVEQTQAVVGNVQYDKIRNDYELFGKWRIVDASGAMNYVYELYKKDSEYIGVILDKAIKLEYLDLKGTKYYLRGSKVGEYYIIDANKNMSLWDKGGNLADIGFKVTKLK